MRAVSIDPGVTTGLAYAEIEPQSHAKIWLEEARLSPLQLWETLTDAAPNHIICEKFEFRNKARNNLELESRDLIGVVRLLAEKDNIPLHMQSAATGKGYYNDDVLKRYGLYVPGKQHSRDAERHLLQWLTFGWGFQLGVADNIELAKGP